MAARQNPQYHRQASKVYGELRAFLRRMLQRLRSVLSEYDSRSISNAFWSFAKLKFNPDNLLPGTLDCLAERYIQTMHTASGQSHSSTLLACVELNLGYCSGKLIQAILQHLQHTDMSDYSAQALSNITYSLALLPAAQPTVSTLDELCHEFQQLLLSPFQDQRPTAQGVANLAWALQELKYAPAPKLASDMTRRMIVLCSFPGQQPKSQEISSFLLACGELRFPLSAAQARFFVNRLLGDRTVGIQALANTAYSLAVVGVLEPDLYTQLLQRLLAMYEASAPLQIANLVQMYQALDKLQSASHGNLQHHDACKCIHAALQELGPRPDPGKTAARQISSALSAALRQLGVQHMCGVGLKSYWLDAVVQPHEGTRPVFISINDPVCFVNQPRRLTGRAMLRQQLLSQAGSLLYVPASMATSSTQLTEYLRQWLDTAAGSSSTAVQFYGTATQRPWRQMP